MGELGRDARESKSTLCAENTELINFWIFLFSFRLAHEMSAELPIYFFVFLKIYYISKTISGIEIAESLCNGRFFGLEI